MASVLGNYHEARPTIIEQSSIVLCASGSLVLGLELTSGELLFSFKGHSDIVTCIYYNEFNSSKVVSVSKNGQVITWDIHSRKELSSHKIDSQLHFAMFPKFTNNPHTGKPDLYIAMNRHSGDDAEVVTNSKTYKLVIFDIENSKIRRNICEVIYPKSAICLANIGGTELILAGSKRKLCIISAESRTGCKVMCPANHSITCVTANSHRDIFVTGHSNGEILIWHDIRNWLSRETANSLVLHNGKTSELVPVPPPTSSIMHWHSHEVISLSTNVDGSMIYSGGDEGVLVVWQTSTGKKAFVPHLGAGIAHVEASHLFPLAIVTTNNNCIRVINTSSLLESWVISSLCVGPFLDHSIPSDKLADCLITVDPKSSLLACNGYPGQLQHYDVSTNSVRGIHEVVQYNRVSRKEKYSKVYVPTVSLFQFQEYHSKKSKATKYLLATVDTRRGEEFAAESSLKFWSWSDAMNSYKLVTHVPRPHGNARITSLSFSPGSPLYTCATSSSDGSVKLWRLDPAVAAGRMFGDAHWSCVYSFTYRATSANAVSFSRDGSLLAVAHANVVTLWDPVTLSLRASLSPGVSDDVTFTAFIEPCAGSRAFLVVGSSSCMAVYDLLTMSVTCKLDGVLRGYSVASSETSAIMSRSTGQNTVKRGNTKADASSTGKMPTPLEAQGWISVCRQKKHQVDDNADDTEYATAESKEGAEWELLVMSPVPSGAVASKDKSAEDITDTESENAKFPHHPLPNIVITSKIASEGTGTAFWVPEVDANSALQGSIEIDGTVANGVMNDDLSDKSCVLVALKTGELILTNLSLYEKADSNQGTRLFPKDGTSLGWADDVARRNESKAASLPAGISFKSNKPNKDAGNKTMDPSFGSSQQVKEGWLGDFFDGTSSNVPPVTEIYEDFMGNLMKKADKGPQEVASSSDRHKDMEHSTSQNSNRGDMNGNGQEALIETNHKGNENKSTTKRPRNIAGFTGLYI